MRRAGSHRSSGQLSELLRKDQSPTVSGVWHEPLRIAFRAAPDLYLWDGETIPLQVGYRFPSESWINEDKSLLSVTLNGTFLNNLPMNKQGPLEKVWRTSGAMRARSVYHPAGALPDLRR
jgi:hypothetical protein